MKRRLQWIIVLLLVAPSLAAAQGTITGTVEDAQRGETIPGVQVFIAELSIGTTTDVSGNYLISGVPAGEHVLEARFVGYRTAEQNVVVRDGEEVVINFELNETSIDLGEVVVTGTGGPVEKRKLGNTVSSISTEDLESAPVQSFSEVLQGRAPGVVGLPSQGQTGGGSRIRIRGLATLSQSNEPAVYVDGVRVDRGGGGLAQVGVSRLDDINPSAIERVEILKGAAAATLYGTEASNGVIQIFTKQGTTGPPRFTFQTRQSVIRMPNRFAPVAGFARSQAQADTMSQYYGGNIQPYQVVERNFAQDLYETGIGQVYSGSISGGTSGITYYVGLRHERENGPFEANFDGQNYPPGVEPIADDLLRRTQATATTSLFPLENLRVRANASYAKSFLRAYPSGNYITTPLSLARYSKPELVAYNNRTGVPSFETVNESIQEDMTQNVDKFTGSLNLNYRPLDALTLDGTFGIDVTNTVNANQTPFGWNIDNVGTGNTAGSRSVTDRNFVEMSFDLKGTLTNSFGERLESTFIAGTQGYRSEVQQEGVSGIDFPGPGFGIASAASEQSVTEFRQEEAGLGVFAQEQVGLDDYLFLTLGARFDANSAFGSEFDAAFYPKVSLSVVPSDADFWQPVGPVSSLRFRVAVGQAGLQPGAFDALTTYAALASVNGAGIVPDNLGNPELKPEVSTEYEFGLDVGLFADRIGIDATYWHRNVRDVLIDRRYPASGGFRNAQLTNIGRMNARGVELAVNGRVLNRDNLSVRLSADAAYLWQEVQDLGGSPPIKGGSSYARIRNFVKEGYAPGAHFGARLLDVEEGYLPVDYNRDGEPDSEEQILAYLAGLTPGTAGLPNSAEVVMRVDENGNGDYLDHYLGKPFPDWSGSFGANVTFMKDFTLSALFEYKFGNYHINNLTYGFRQANAGIGRNLPKAARVERDFITGGVEGGTPQNDPEVRLEALKTWVNEVLALEPFSGVNSIEPGDYLRWRELSLTYDLPRELVSGFGANRLSLTLAARNLALWTKFRGTDPELNIAPRGGTDGTSDEDLNEGVVAYGIPVPRRFTFSLLMQF